MITSPPKRGMALVVVLVLLAVMMLVTITLSGRMQQQLGRTRSQQEYQQALWYSASAESLALSALSLSLKNEKRVHLAQPWASGLLHGSSKFRGRNDLFSCGHSSKTSPLVLLAPEK